MIKSVDDTPLPESESEEDIWAVLSDLAARLYLLEKELALLQEQRVANEYNQDDPEWY